MHSFSRNKPDERAACNPDRRKRRGPGEEGGRKENREGTFCKNAPPRASPPKTLVWLAVTRPSSLMWTKGTHSENSDSVASQGVGAPVHDRSAHSQFTVRILEFLPEGPGTGFLHKKRVPGFFVGSEAGSRNFPSPWLSAS